LLWCFWRWRMRRWCRLWWWCRVSCVIVVKEEKVEMGVVVE
jgi:hypothetical protein